MIHMIELKLTQVLNRKPTLEEVMKSIQNSKLKTALKRYMFNTFDSAHFFLEQLRDPYNDNGFPTYRSLPDGHYDQTDFFDEMIFTMDPESLKLSFKPEFAEFLNAQLENDPAKIQAGCPMIHSPTFDSFSQWIIDLQLHYRFGAPIKGCQVLDANESTILRRIKNGLKKKYGK